MAVRQGSQINDNDGRMNYLWSGLLNGDTGTPAGTMEHVADYTLQVTGTFGVGGSVALQGSNDGGVTFFALEDVTGTTIAATTNKIWRLSHITKQVRPIVTAGDGTTTVTVNLSGVIR